ncbi:MAG: hypothetical protein R2873_07385 [Caldilineaceae bacterium]
MKSGQQVRIRPYQVGDAATVSAIIRTTMRVSNSADYAPERLQPLIDYFSPAKVDQINETRTCLVAEVSGVLVATAGLEDDELVTFFVLPEWQGRGIGGAVGRVRTGGTNTRDHRTEGGRQRHWRGVLCASWLRAHGRDPRRYGRSAGVDAKTAHLNRSPNRSTY